VGLDQRDVVRRLRGPLGSEVNLTVARRQNEDAGLVDINVVRAHIVPQTVRYSHENGIATFRVTSFNQDTARSLQIKILAARRELGPDLKGLILDLRGNPGGLLDQSVTVSDLFINQGRIVSTHGRHPDSHQYFDAQPYDIAEGLPLVVLVNGYSASASEIVAAALQDAGRAVVVGSNSFGKGTVQTVLRLPNDGELTLTWARFHAPSGYALEGRGVLPDICTTDGATDAEDVLERVRQGLLPFSRSTIRQEVAASDMVMMKEIRGRCPARHDDDAIDVEVAESLLLDPALYAHALGQLMAGVDDALHLETAAVAHN
jgi:carboxyl-terminal processing protease